MDELKELRKKIFITGYRGGMAHLASCFSCLEILYALYSKGVLRYDRRDPMWHDRDRFILSKGHAGLALYCVLQHEGLITEKMLGSYLMEDSVIGGEPCVGDCEWIEATTGSLGHGLPIGTGMAMALRADKSDARVYVMLGDGECEEGSVWEAAMMAASQRLDNLIVILDCNKIQKMDTVSATIGEPEWRRKWESFGWAVSEVDGHDVDELKNELTGSDPVGKPRLVIAHTIKGKGVSLMENNPNWHFKLPGRRELEVFKAELEIADTELQK